MQRIDMNIILNRLDRSETGKYIAAHMGYARAKQELFTMGQYHWMNRTW